MTTKLFSTEDLELMENLLDELLEAAIKAAPHMGAVIAELAIGVSDKLSPEAVERAKDYALYRAKQEVVRGV